MALLLVRLLIFSVMMLFILHQIILPLIKGDPVFPFFLGEERPVQDAEQELFRARSAKKAAELNKQAADLNQEASQINNNLKKNKRRGK